MNFKNILTVAALALILFSCSDDKKAQLARLKGDRDKLDAQIAQLEKEIASSDTSKAKVSEMHVSLTTIKPGIFEHFVEVQGKVDGDDNLGVSAKMMGVITDIFVKEGEQVKKGQVLAQIDDKVMRQGLEEIETQLSLAKTAFTKQKALWDQKIGSEMQFLGAKTNLEALEKRKETLLDQIDMNKVKSPINGTVEDIPIKIGQAVSPGLPIMRVVNFESMKVVADVAEAYTAQIKKGNSVQVYFPDIDQTVNAEIDFSSKYINPINRTFSVIARFAEQGMDVRANMVAVLRIRDYVSENSIRVPIGVVQSDASGQYVYIAVPGENALTSKKINVTTGKSYNGVIEITSGLKQGDKLVSVGYQDLIGGEMLLVE